MIGSVYDYYLTTYVGKPSTRSDTHKKSELRNIYNNIVKISRKSPLYKVDVSESIQRYAIDLKENARSIKSKTDVFFNDNTSATLQKKLISTNDEVLSINYLGTTDDREDKIETNLSYDIHVDELAKPQVNIGNFVKSNSSSIIAGDHVFDINIGEYSYEFQFKVNSEDTNKSILDKLSRLVNRSDIGLTAQTISDEYNRSALKLTSVSTGSSYTESIFTLNNSDEYPTDDTINYFGLNNVSQISSDAKFTLNGLDKTSASNIFTINKNIEITLNNISEPNESTIIKYQDDIDSIIDSIHGIANSYNSIIDLAKNTSAESDQTHSLLKDIKNITSRYKNDLESIGLKISEDDHLNFDDSLIIQSAKDNNIAETLNHLKVFKEDLSAKADDISINPMKYVKKVMISYPNPKKPFANPYLTSIYTGMMYNGYI